MSIPTYTYAFISATLTMSGISIATAQDTTQPTKPAEATAKKSDTLSPEELATRKASIPLIEERIKDRESQIEVLLKDMERISNRIENRIDKIVNVLSKMKDSQNSKIRVAQMKQNTMKGLYRTIENYNKRRAELKEQLRTGNAKAGSNATNKGVALFDAKIEKRADQLITLSKSFTEHVDYKKYENDNSYDGYNNGGWAWDNSRVSEEWKQNRRETTHTDGQRKKMIQALKASINDLETRNNTLRNKSKEGKVSSETKKFYQEDIARNEKAIATRSKQLEELMQPSSSTSTTSVDRNQAHDTQLMIREIAADIRKDSNTNTANYNELKIRLSKLNQMKKNLEARKAWLKKYETAKEKSAE